MKIPASARFLLLSAALAGAGPALPAQDAPREIDITARRFAFVPNEVHLKKGQTVALVVKSLDVTHGFFCRPLKIDARIQKDQETRVPVTPGQEGTYTVICNHFCGSGHAGMKMKIIVE